jgi:NAD(P)H-flavin reductase
MAMADDMSPAIPLSVAETDPTRGLITLIIQEVGSTSKKLADTPIGQSFFNILGPLGTPVELKKSGVVVCIGYEIGIAQILHICRALRKSEAKTIAIIGARTKKSLILENQMRLTCSKVFISTDDGSYESRGSVIHSLREAMIQEKIGTVYAAAPVEILQGICQTTAKKKIKTFVHLNPVMIDGIGLCGSCRVKLAEEEAFVCIDGPMLDGHLVDFEDFAKRI